jgi:hypothetical protein
LPENTKAASNPSRQFSSKTEFKRLLFPAETRVQATECQHLPMYNPSKLEIIVLRAVMEYSRPSAAK